MTKKVTVAVPCVKGGWSKLSTFFLNIWLSQLMLCYMGAKWEQNKWWSWTIWVEEWQDDIWSSQKLSNYCNISGLSNMRLFEITVLSRIFPLTLHMHGFSSVLMIAGKFMWKTIMN